MSKTDAPERTPLDIATLGMMAEERAQRAEAEVERLRAELDTKIESCPVCEFTIADNQRLRAAIREMPCGCKKDFAGDRGGDYECHRCRALTEGDQ